MSDYEFPEELLRAKREWLAIADQLETFPLRPWTDRAGLELRPAEGWTAELDRREGALRRRFRELSIQISIHPYWESVEGSVVAARMALRQAALARPVPRVEGCAAQGLYNVGTPVVP